MTSRRQAVTQFAREIGIALHELFFVFRPINAGEVKHKVGTCSQFRQLTGLVRSIKLQHLKAAPAKSDAEIPANKAASTSN